jgi:quercetin dioxygenase-like cupin family protein
MKMIAAAVMSLTLGASALAQTGTTGTAPASTAPGNASGNPAQMVIARAGSQASTKGPAQNFTGSVRVDPLFGVRAPSSVSGGAVTFEPGARSAWHTHPMGQVLIVTAGAGRIQQWGGVVEQIRPGDVIWTPPGVKHWHGAAPTTAVTHIAIQESANGKNVEWMEKVSDEQYGK